MKSSNAFQRQKERLLKRWSEEDYPGGTPRFQLYLLAKDVAIFCLIPLGSIVGFKLLEASVTPGKKVPDRKRLESTTQRNEKHSQIISFQGPPGSGVKPGSLAFRKRAPGTLVRVKLLNAVETLSAAPVHAQIIDAGLGSEFLGGTILGDATPEAGVGRIKIDFRFVRHPKRLDIAVPLAARAMSLDGTFGLAAQKKEGFFARAAIRSASGKSNPLDASTDKQDFRTLVARAVAAGMLQEFESEAGVAHAKAQVLTLKPLTEFYAELTDYFPGRK